ncbi:MAG TPA: hypothetical protein DDW52_16060 [Planctomycetaceae bacterium]|nr:hypothetical protein [Planctomycetaceae bacterium]
MLNVQTVGSVNVIKVRSALQDECLANARKTVQDCLDKRRFWLILNLHDCPLINSQGLEFIVDSQQDCLARGGRLVVAEPQPLTSEILGVTGIDEQVAVYRDMRGALSDFAR